MLLDSLFQRMRALRRDVVTVAGALVGRNPPPLVRVTARGRYGLIPSPSPHAPAPSPHALRRMRVARLLRETADAVTVVLEDVGGAPVRFEAGQFFTLHVPLEDGEVARRAYSASSSPLDGGASVSVTVKRVAGGRVSSHIVERLREGDAIDVLGPSGGFVPAPARDPRRVVLVGGGSGITPLASIARTLLVTEPATRVVLVYGNRTREDVIFHDALEALARDHGESGRFLLRHVLQVSPAGWRGGVGLLDGPALLRELHAVDVPDALPTQYFLCGPDPMMRSARASLVAYGIPHASIQEERFVSAHAPPATRPAEAHVLVLRSPAGERRLTVPAGHTLLQAALDARVDVPFSCTVGGCGACRVRLVDGEVAMDEPNCLTPSERAEGYVLTCVSRAAGPCTLEVP